MVNAEGKESLLDVTQMISELPEIFDCLWEAILRSRLTRDHAAMGILER